LGHGPGMKIKMTMPKVAPPTEVVDLDLVRARMRTLARRQADRMAEDLTKGLQSAARSAEESYKAEGDVPERFSSVKEDADHIQFVARDGPHSLVGDREIAEAQVDVADTPMPSGRDPETVVGAFEFGSAALSVPATQFNRRAEQRQQEARDVWEGIVED